AAAVILAVLAALGVGLRNADRRHLAPITPTTTTAPAPATTAHGTGGTAHSPGLSSVHAGSCVAITALRC
ncbi:MAG: hypothetical protein M3O28_02625, partial [Actinomycetota bacterium]|nr:hypothetical protein [Actinomycetota bacterium]